MPVDASIAVDLTPGLIVRLAGLRGLWRAVGPCQDRTGRAWWFLPCDAHGRWNQKEGFRARPVADASARRRDA